MPQLTQRAHEGVPVHSQHLRGFALIPIDLSENRKDELFFEFFQRFGIESAVRCIRNTNRSSCAFVAYVCFVPMFDSGRLLHRRVDMYESLAAEGERAGEMFATDLRTLVWKQGQLPKCGAAWILAGMEKASGEMPEAL